MKEFLKYRDNEPMFDKIREKGRVGIPFFLLEDGTMTFKIEDYVDVALDAVEKPVNACSLDGKGNC